MFSFDFYHMFKIIQNFNSAKQLEQKKRLTLGKCKPIEVNSQKFKN